MTVKRRTDGIALDEHRGHPIFLTTTSCGGKQDREYYVDLVIGDRGLTVTAKSIGELKAKVDVALAAH